MGDEVCSTCGQTLDAPDIEVRLRANGEPSANSTARSAEFTLTHHEQSRRARRGWLLLAGGVGVVALAIWSVSSGSDGAVEQPDPAGSSAISDTPIERGIDTPTPSDTAINAQIDETLSDFHVVYLAKETVVIVNPITGDEPFVEIEPRSYAEPPTFTALSELDLLSEGTRTFGIELEGGLAVRLSGIGRLVATNSDGMFVVAGDPTEPWETVYATTSYGLFMVGLDVPGGSVQLEVPGLGVLVGPPTGGTFIASLAGFERFSNGRVIAATAAHFIELSCDDSLRCGPALVEIETGDRQELPGRVVRDGSNVSISPDGRWVIAGGSEIGSVFDATTGNDASLVLGPTSEFAWAPDSSFVAWLDTTSEQALLKVLRPDDLSEVREIDLASAGAATPSGKSLLVLS